MFTENTTVKKTDYGLFVETKFTSGGIDYHYAQAYPDDFTEEEARGRFHAFYLPLFKEDLERNSQ